MSIVSCARSVHTMDLPALFLMCKYLRKVNLEPILHGTRLMVVEQVPEIPKDTTAYSHNKRFYVRSESVKFQGCDSKSGWFTYNGKSTPTKLYKISNIHLNTKMFAIVCNMGHIYNINRPFMVASKWNLDYIPLLETGGISGIRHKKLLRKLDVIKTELNSSDQGILTNFQCWLITERRAISEDRLVDMYIRPNSKMDATRQILKSIMDTIKLEV